MSTVTRTHRATMLNDHGGARGAGIPRRLRAERGHRGVASRGSRGAAGTFFETATLERVTDCLWAGAEVNARDRRRNTPLHFAASATDDPLIGATACTVQQLQPPAHRRAPGGRRGTRGSQPPGPNSAAQCGCEQRLPCHCRRIGRSRSSSKCNGSSWPYSAGPRPRSGNHRAAACGRSRVRRRLGVQRWAVPARVASRPR